MTDRDVRSWLVAGSAVPDPELTDADSSPRRLSELVGGDPTLLHFYRS